MDKLAKLGIITGLNDSSLRNMTKATTLTKKSSSQAVRSVYEPPQQVQYLYLQAEVDVLLRQLENCQAPANP